MGYGENRPSATGCKTEIDGLYMAGASTHPGGLVFLANGYNAAGVVAKDLGLDIWWKEPEFVRKAKSSVYL